VATLQKLRFQRGFDLLLRRAAGEGVERLVGLAIGRVIIEQLPTVR